MISLKETIKEKIPQIDALFRELDTTKTPGYAMAIEQNGENIYSNGYGMANLEYGIPINPETIFHVASISKQFTAFAVLILESEGILSVDDEIKKHIPEFPDFGKKITIQHLLNHTSGLRDQWELLITAGWRWDDVITQEDLLNVIYRQKELNFEPGSEYLYCNSGYTLLTVIVDNVSGMKFTDFTKKYIFDPLGMKHTHFHIDHKRIVKNRAYSYGINKEGKLEKNVLSFANVGPTSLFTTVEDLMKWGNNFKTGTAGGMLPVEKLQVKGILNDGKEISYANGLEVEEYRGLPMVRHSGGDAGFRTYFLRFPSLNTTITCFSNFGLTNPAEITHQVADLLFADKMTEKTSTELDTTNAHKYDKPEEIIGTYDLAEFGVLDINMVEEVPQLPFLITTFLPPLPILPAEDNPLKYLIKEFGAEIVFKDFKDGKCQDLLVYIFGKEYKGKRIEGWDVSSEVLKEYEGKYYSDELECKYEIIVKANELVVQNPRWTETELRTLRKDQFSNVRGKFLFQRNAEGDIDGFSFTNARIRKLKFAKME
jgi:CubicO group peptidase (beta-lactamase class C family)